MKLNTLTSISSGNTWYSPIMNCMTTNNTDGTIDDNVAHGNQVSRSSIIHSNTLSSHDRLIRVHRDALATNDVLNFKIDNAYESLRGREVHDDNTHAECDTVQLIVEFRNVSMYNISPTRWDGRGVSTERFEGTHPISLD